MSEHIFLRDMTDADLPLVMAWRSNPLIWQGFYSQRDSLVWATHYTWWKNRPQSWKQFIISLVQDTVVRDIGVVTIGQLEHWSPEIGYFIGEVSLWGKGYGKKAVSLALEWLKANGDTHCHTTVLKSNERSIRLLKSLGFVEGMAGRDESEVYYQKELR